MHVHVLIAYLQRNPARRPQKSLDEPLAEKSLGTLLMDFFRHYGHDFSYATHYISVSGRTTNATLPFANVPVGSDSWLGSMGIGIHSRLSSHE